MPHRTREDLLRSALADSPESSLALALSRVETEDKGDRGFTLVFSKIRVWNVPMGADDGLPDPYLRFTLLECGGKNPPVGRTPDKRNEPNPSWERPVRLRLPAGTKAARSLRPLVSITLCDRDPQGVDDELCQLSIRLFEGTAQLHSKAASFTATPRAAAAGAATAEQPVDVSQSCRLYSKMSKQRLRLNRTASARTDATISFSYEIVEGAAAEDEDNRVEDRSMVLQKLKPPTTRVVRKK